MRIYYNRPQSVGFPISDLDLLLNVICISSEYYILKYETTGGKVPPFSTIDYFLRITGNVPFLYS